MQAAPAHILEASMCVGSLQRFRTVLKTFMSLMCTFWFALHCEGVAEQQAASCVVASDSVPSLCEGSACLKDTRDPGSNSHEFARIRIRPEFARIR